MKTYLISLLIVVVLISLVQIILPKGKISAAATSVLAFAAVLCFLKPLSGLSLDISDYKSKDKSEKQVASFNEYVDSSLEKYYETAFIEVLKENDIICEKAIVEICDKKIVKTEIYLSNLVIDENYEHININVITDYIAEKIGVSKDKLIVYG